MRTTGNGMKKAHEKAVRLWRARITAAAAVLSAVSSLLLAPGGLPWLCVTGMWAAAYIFMFAFYYPIKYKKLSFGVINGRLAVNCGVFYTRVKAIPLRNIQYLYSYRTPMQRCWGMSSLVFMAAGGRMYVPCMRTDDADSLMALCAAQGGFQP